MRGFFGIGVEGISKEQNVGTIVRSTHAFGGSFFFSIAPDVDIEKMRVSDTADSFDHLPYYQYESPAHVQLPQECTLVGVELTDDAVELPSFRHPTRAAYVFGPEMGSLSPAMIERCAYTVKIPMKFCVNVGVAAALLMYDRMICLGRFAERPVSPGGPYVPLEAPKRVNRRKIRRKS